MKEDGKSLESSESNLKQNNKIICFVICIMVCVIVLLIMVINIKKSASQKEEVPKSIKEYFFSDSKLLKEEDILKVKGEIVKVDDYVFQLKESLVDTNVVCGYMMIEIRKNNGETISNEELEERFGFTMSITGTMNKKFVNVDDKIYLFIDFASDKDFDNKLQVMDYTKIDDKTESGYSTYIFNVSKISNALKFNIDEKTNLFLSSIGIGIEANKEIKNVYMDVYYKDGKKENLYNTKNNKYDNHMDEFGCSSLTNGDSPEDDYYWYYDIFEEILKISDVDYIVFNGEKYTLE